MTFSTTPLAGVFVITLEPIADDRGTFSRSFCAREFAEHGLESAFVQSNISTNRRKGTLRGMHVQIPPFAEAKLVRCSRGAIFDAVVDIRQGSATFLRWFGLTLSADKSVTLYVPRGFAHGFLTLEDETEVEYQMSNFYSPDHARGFRYDDPTVGIAWPAEVICISERDRTAPAFVPEDLGRLGLR